MTRILTRRAFVVGAPLALAACSAEPVWAPDDVVRTKRYASNGPTKLTLYTVLNKGSGNGAHSALLVDASERVIFDPAGSFKAASVPERNDVLIGISPTVEQAYVSFHARSDYDMVIQEILVAPEVAEKALLLVKSNGAVPKAGCTRATSAIIAQLPGFEGVGRTWFPNNLSEAFGELPGVTTRVYTEND